MNNDSILQRYFEMEKSGIGHYFDADEILELLAHFEYHNDLDQYQKAVEFGLKLYPHNREIQIHQCNACVCMQDYEKALAMIEQLSSICEEDVSLLRCECLCALDRYDELNVYLDSLRQQPDNEVEDLFEFLVCLLEEELNDPENAYKFVKRGLELFPDNDMLKEELCYYLELQGETEAAVKLCKELIDEYPYSVDSWFVLGRLYSIMELYDNAIEAYDFALVCDKDDEKIKILKAFCHFKNNNYEKLVETCTDFFTDNIKDNSQAIQVVVKIPDDSDSAYMLLKRMIRKLEDSERHLFVFHNLGIDGEARGLPIVADCFPSSALFLIVQEMRLMNEGDCEAITNIEQLLQIIYFKLNNNPQLKIESNDTYYLAARQIIFNIVDHQLLTHRYQDKDFLAAHHVIRNLFMGEIGKFCQQYAQISPTLITQYFERLFPDGKKPPQRSSYYLSASEINRDQIKGLSSNELSATMLTNKNHLN